MITHTNALPPQHMEHFFRTVEHMEGWNSLLKPLAVCPVIIQWCQWETKPYRGTPTELVLPLSFMYIHCTFQPSQPCLSFQQCSANMRAMQHFHQDDRGWDDIGYSFMVGLDGYIYEGHGWQWRGAHTKGHNSRGYGISLIRDYTADLPARHALELWRGRMTATLTMHGHWQLVNTSCPGDALYSEIQGWEHFREVQP
ncbi:N-acetylmuramoyl-L-alanine amidase-like [Megalops cyprinoides]|uniref:N-acetylmuramoyl-L-alanine amidase-like n=1 Tax=Megalops cyprinoides TaxID=118141 RepID=UPI001864A543|nr:N-acetylmuramoyl-L-alanine amidase-like [Megalops cyprinoides]